MAGMGSDRDLMRWTDLFMLNRRMRLVINGHQCTKPEVETVVPQRLPVSHILFAIYFKGVFREVEN